MYYTLNQWETLTGYCDNGHLRISNILAENAIRPLAIGRRNWLCVSRRRIHDETIMLTA
jgi:transposase